MQVQLHFLHLDRDFVDVVFDLGDLAFVEFDLAHFLIQKLTSMFRLILMLCLQGWTL